jgi:hypothetical protein
VDTVCKKIAPKVGGPAVLPGSASDKPLFIKRLSLLKGGERIEDRGHCYERPDHQHQQVGLTVPWVPFLEAGGEPSFAILTV